MKTFVLLAMGITALAMSGCANDLSPEETNNGPAPFSPDPTSHVTPVQNTTPLGGNRF